MNWQGVNWPLLGLIFAGYIGGGIAIVAFFHWARGRRRAGDRLARKQPGRDAPPRLALAPYPEPGEPQPREAPHQENAAPPVARRAPAPGRARESYRAPGEEDLGTCLFTSRLYDTGVAVVQDHVRKRRITFRPPAGEESDAAFFARIEREMRQQ